MVSGSVKKITTETMSFFWKWYLNVNPCFLYQVTKWPDCERSDYFPCSNMGRETLLFTLESLNNLEFKSGYVKSNNLKPSGDLKYSVFLSYMQ